MARETNDTPYAFPKLDREISSYKDVGALLSSAIESGELKPGARLPTLRDLAGYMHVAPMTVRRAVNVLQKQGKIRVSKGSGIFVATSGNRPKAISSLLTIRIHDVPGDFLVQSYLDRSFSDMMMGVQQCAKEFRISNTLMLLAQKADEYFPKLDKVELEHVYANGAVLLWTGTTPEYASYILQTLGSPVVFYDSGDLLEGFNCLRIDMWGGARRAMRYLVEMGHRRVGILGAADRNSYLQRYQAVEEFITAGQIVTKEAWMPSCQETISDIHAAIDAMLDLPADDRPTAVFCFNDLRALELCDAARQRSIHIPEDLSVFGFDGTPQAINEGITTVQLPYLYVGFEAVNLLRWVLQHPERPPSTINVGMNLIPGNTVKDLRGEQATSR